MIFTYTLLSWDKKIIILHILPIKYDSYKVIKQFHAHARILFFGEQTSLCLHFLFRQSWRTFTWSSLSVRQLANLKRPSFPKDGKETEVKQWKENFKLQYQCGDLTFGIFFAVILLVVF